MSCSSVSRGLVVLDHTCDYVPGISILSNLTDLFLKYVVFPFVSAKTLANDQYYVHVEEKSTLRSICLVIPLIGNLFVYIYDVLNKWNDERAVLEAIGEDPSAFSNASERLRNDPLFVGRAIQRDVNVLQYVNAWLKNDKQFMLYAVGLDGQALKYAEEALKNDEDLVKAAVSQDGLALEYVGESFKNNEDIITLALDRCVFAIQFVSKDFQNKNRGMVRSVIFRDLDGLPYVSEELRDDPDFMFEIVAEQGCLTALQDASDRLRNNSDFMKRVFKQYPNNPRQVSVYIGNSLTKNREFMEFAKERVADSPFSLLPQTNPVILNSSGPWS